MKFVTFPLFNHDLCPVHLPHCPAVMPDLIYKEQIYGEQVFISIQLDCEVL